MRERIEDMEALAAALREVADRVAPTPTPADTRDVVREGLNAGRDELMENSYEAGYHPAMVKLEDVIAALDEAPAETLPEWAAVDDFGALIIELQFSTLKVHTYIPDDLDRISKATHIRAALLRREARDG